MLAVQQATPPPTPAAFPHLLQCSIAQGPLPCGPCAAVRPPMDPTPPRGTTHAHEHAHTRRAWPGALLLLQGGKYFMPSGRLNWPDGAASRKSVKAVRRLTGLEQLILDQGGPCVCVCYVGGGAYVHISICHGKGLWGVAPGGPAVSAWLQSCSWVGCGRRGPRLAPCSVAARCRPTGNVIFSMATTLAASVSILYR